MNTAMKVMKYAFFDLVRSRWLIIYTLFFLAATSGLLYFGQDPAQVALSSLNLVLLIIPLVALMLGMNYYYYTRDFVQLLLTQPISRRAVFFGQFAGVAIPLAAAFVVGTGLPMLVYGFRNPLELTVLTSLLLSGALVSLVFTALAFWIGIANEDRARALGFALGLWLALTVAYDGVVMLYIVLAQAYPIDRSVLGLVMLNPVDLSRILVLLQLDTAALMGYTGAVFQRFLGSGSGAILSMFALLAWIALPLTMASRSFARKNF